jgi:hypothetical protein
VLKVVIPLANKQEIGVGYWERGHSSAAPFREQTNSRGKELETLNH